MNIFEITGVIFFAISLCADCFAVSLCSSTTLKRIDWKNVLAVSLSFAVIQTGLLLLGWGFGYLFLGFVEKVAHIIGFALLLYVGGSMLIGALRNEQECRNLNGMRNVIIGGVATSIDALAVGVSMSMDSIPWSGIRLQALAVFIVTAISVIVGIWGGKTIGSRVGRIAELAGGVVLIAIGVCVLVGFDLLK